MTKVRLSTSRVHSSFFFLYRYFIFTLYLHYDKYSIAIPESYKTTKTFNHRVKLYQGSDCIRKIYPSLSYNR